MTQGTLIAIDPGTNHAGIAWFQDGRFADGLLLRGTIDAMSLELSGYRSCDLGVLEHPQHYPGSKTPPNDLIKLGVAGGLLMGAARPRVTRRPVPAEWKGQVPKKIHNARALAKLDARERAVLEGVDSPAYMRHNVTDAIALGLWALGRM